MKQFATFTLCAALCAPVSAHAQNKAEPDPSPMERGLRLFLEGLMDEMGPALERLQDLGPGLRDFMMQMGPSLRDLMEEVQDWSVYEAPEILPNGDIIIRRKPEETNPKEEGQIDI